MKDFWAILSYQDYQNKHWCGGQSLGSIFFPPFQGFLVVKPKVQGVCSIIPTRILLNFWAVCISLGLWTYEDSKNVVELCIPESLCHGRRALRLRRWRPAPAASSAACPARACRAARAGRAGSAGCKPKAEGTASGSAAIWLDSEEIKVQERSLLLCQHSHRPDL